MFFQNPKTFLCGFTGQEKGSRKLKRVESRRNSLRATFWLSWHSGFPHVSAFADRDAGVGHRIYIGEEYDESTGLSYLNARYYDGARGRFISQDTKFIEMNDYDFLFDPQQMNSYSYGRNNPLKYIDPEGEKVELVAKSI